MYVRFLGWKTGNAGSSSFRPTVLFSVVMAVTVLAGSLWVTPSTPAQTQPALSPTLLAGALVTQVAGQARINTISASDLVLSLEFIDARGVAQTINFTRMAPTECWKAQSVGGASVGVLFGNTTPRYPSIAKLRDVGITPIQGVRTFDASIVSRPLDDLTIFQLYEAGEMAILLWQQGVVTEIWYVGSLVDDMLNENIAPAGRTFCDRALELCCRTIRSPYLSGPRDIPAPRISSCSAVARTCSSLKNRACNCLLTACNFCFDHPGLCSDPALPWLQNESEAACDAGVANCTTSPAGSPPAPTQLDLFLDELANRLQTLIDIQDNLN